jgi:hypothetical protein
MHVIPPYPHSPPPPPTQLLTCLILMSGIPAGTVKGFCYKFLPFIAFCHSVPDTEVSLHFEMCCLHASESPSGLVFNETTLLHRQALLPSLVWPLLPTHCSCRGLLLHLIIPIHTAHGRAALDEWSVCRRDLCVTTCRVQLKCDGTRWRTGGEVKGKLANGVRSQYSSHYLGTWCIQHYRWSAYLGCQ